jgi:signal transduction histidine kinase
VRMEDSKPRILVIDDEQGLRDMLVYGLSQRDYVVVTAENGSQALEKARESSFDLGLCDIMMPGMSGVDVLRELKILRPDMEVVMATGCATIETAVESMKLGAYDYITKPYELDHLCQTLSRALEKRRLKNRVGELEGLNRMKSEFLANMSHELRTPLNAIVGYTSLLLDGTYGELPSEQAEPLERVLVGSKDLLTLINSVLDLSKLNAGMMPVFLEDIDVAELAGEVVETMRALAVRKGLTLRAECPSMRLRGDRTKTKQILINLIGNSIKFTDKGSVRLSSVFDAERGRVVLSVTDTGPGIPDESLTTIFEEFRQLDGSAQREHGGTGLGLAIVKKLAVLLGGEIAVRSRVGEGSVFEVSLPTSNAKPALAPVLPPAVLAEPGDERPVVIGIDDDPEVLRLLTDSLAQSGYRFVGAQTGAEGIAMARKLKPCAVTLDVMMPHCDGWSVLQSFQNDAELRSIPVIILSIVENKGLGVSLGATDYIVKPFQKQDLVEKLRALTPAAPGPLRRREVSLA